MSLKEWLLEYIGNNPNCNFGSVWRDACFDHNLKFNSNGDDMHNAIEKIKSEGNVIETGSDYNTFYNLSTQLNRDRKINQII